MTPFISGKNEVMKHPIVKILMTSLPWHVRPFSPSDHSWRQLSLLELYW
jgi:hypothetical protein